MKIILASKSNVRKQILEKNNISSETFNLTKDTLSVKEVAEVCKKNNPKIILKEP